MTDAIAPELAAHNHSTGPVNPMGLEDLPGGKPGGVGSMARRNRRA